MSWKKNSPEAVRRFDTLAAVPGARRGLLFGCPVYTLGEVRYASLHAERFVLRLSPADTATLLAAGGTMFEPHAGRPSKERVVVPEQISAEDDRLVEWIRRAAGYAAGS